MTRIKKIDHVAYACGKGMLEKWAWFHIELEGGTLINRIDDVDPDNENSSMKIWCIDFGAFGIALVEGIDRNQKSQVTAFVEKHGDHTVQHIAYDTGDLDGFLAHLLSHNVRLRGAVQSRFDGFGQLKQVFCKGYASQDAAEMSFPEYVERPVSGGKRMLSFSAEVGKSLYNEIESARESEDHDTLMDFSVMPEDWQPPEPAQA